MTIISKKDEDIPQRLAIYMSKTKAKTLRSVDMGNFMNWIHVNLTDFRKENNVRGYMQLTDKQEEQFTEFLKEAKIMRVKKK